MQCMANFIGGAGEYIYIYIYSLFILWAATLTATSTSTSTVVVAVAVVVVGFIFGAKQICSADNLLKKLRLRLEVGLRGKSLPITLYPLI